MSSHYGYKARSTDTVGCGVQVVFLLIVALFAIGIWAFASRMEAAAYNRLTNGNATTWDAMWVNLRVVPTN